MPLFSEINSWLLFKRTRLHAGTMQRDDMLHFICGLAKYIINYKRMTSKMIKKKKKNHDDGTG